MFNRNDLDNVIMRDFPSPDNTNDVDPKDQLEFKNNPVHRRNQEIFSNEVKKSQGLNRTIMSNPLAIMILKWI